MYLGHQLIGPASSLTTGACYTIGLALQRSEPPQASGAFKF
jgi:hypothetical protein